jgi:uncharacterized protein (TIGR00369 family)
MDTVKNIPENNHPDERTKIIRWEDPMKGAAKAMTMDGFDYLNAIITGTVPPPPIAMLLDIRIKEIKPGEVFFEVTPGEYHYNPIGMVHGGLLATMMDSAMGCAIQSVLKAGTGYSTVDLQVTYVKSAKIDTGLLTCSGKIIHEGGKIATAYSEVKDSQGNLYAHATTTCMIFRPEKIKTQ